MKDYYSLLGVDRKATKAEIKKNYRLLATKYHPDKNSDPDAATKFMAISEAYDILSNKKSRVQYDLLRWEQQKQKQAAEDSFTVVVPPVESTRTRRNKAQQKRSLQYHKANSQWQLVLEGFHIVGRYVPHLLGMTLLLVVLNSGIPQLSAAFEKNLLRGLFVALIMGIVVYGLGWVASHVYQEMKKDVGIFAVFYKITQQKAVIFVIAALMFLLLFYGSILIVFF